MLALMRWQALLSVEDMLREVFAVVDEYDAMQRTFFLFTSDHGCVRKEDERAKTRSSSAESIVSRHCH